MTAFLRRRAAALSGLAALLLTTTLTSAQVAAATSPATPSVTQAAVLASALAAAAAPPGRSAASSGRLLLTPAAGAGSTSGLPDDGPPALYRPEPRLPPAAGWDGPESFPRTSGTGRLDAGALLWTDWLYDDHGAVTAPLGDPAQTAGSPSLGGYGYPAGPAHGNGADIVRAGVLLRGDATVWRVDWSTLADAAVPLAVWTFDRDGDATTGSAAWPAGAGVSSPGIDSALVVSGRRARLLELPSGRVLATLPVHVDLASRSFVVTVPRTVLAPTGAWTVRLGAGLADPAGTGLAAATGALPGQTRLYNLTFRERTQEPVPNSFWDDRFQTARLTRGDATPFAQQVRWADLAAGSSTAEQRPTGWSTRWYASAVELGPGVRTDPTTIADNKANYLGRVQPYSVYVPAGLTGPAPLTFLLHSLTQNHNQYAATTPDFVRLACEQRRSICVSTLGRGGDGFFLDEAQLDFWQVWHEVAKAFPLDPERTVIAGYSMGGIGSNQIGMAHPDLFATIVTLAGAVGNVPELENLRSVPLYLAGGVADELVPLPVQRNQANALDALGFRYRWLVYPAEDHVAYELRDGFDDAAAYMGDARRTTRPAHVTLRWSPAGQGGGERGTSSLGPTRLATTQRPDLGAGTTGAYWLRELAARRGVLSARVDATSSALPDPVVTQVRGTDVQVPGSPSPALVTELTWQLRASPPRSNRLALDLTGVGALTVRTADAGLPITGCSTVVVTTDGASRLLLDSGAGRTAVAVPSSRTLLVRTAAGTAPAVVGECSGTSAPVAGAPGQSGGAVAGSRLPATGLPLLPTLLGTLCLLMAAGVRSLRRDG